MVTLDAFNMSAFSYTAALSTGQSLDADCSAECQRRRTIRWIQQQMITEDDDAPLTRNLMPEMLQDINATRHERLQQQRPSADEERTTERLVRQEVDATQ